jgi:hypothetical protein
LQAVVPEDDELDLLALNQIEKLCGARAELIGVLIMRPCRAVAGEESLHHDRVYREQNRSSAWQANEDRLVPGNMATGFDQIQAGKNLCVAVDEAVAEMGLIPMSASALKAGISGASPFVMGALNDELSVWE